MLLSLALANHALAEDAGSLFEASVDDPVTLQSVHRQARLLGSWANELQEKGVGIPVDLIPVVSKALSLGAHDSRDRMIAVHERLLARGNELRLLEDNAGIIGRGVMDAPGRLVAGQRVQLRQVYEVGTTLEAGSALAIAKHWTYPYSLQTSRPRANNYVTVTTDGDATLGWGTVLRDGIHGGLYRDARLPLVEIREGSLQPGDRIIIAYGAGARGFLLPDQAMENFVLPLYLRRNAGDHFMTVPVDTMEVTGGPAASLTAALPSIMTPGQVAELKVRLEDEFGNVATGEFPSLEILVNGLFHDRIPAGGEPLPVLDDIAFETTGLHRVEIRSSGGGLVGKSNPVLVVEEEPQYRILWADLHRHTTLSDGVHAPKNIEASALSDIALPVDHDNYLGRSRWREMSRNNEVNGFEWSLPVQKGGHHLVLTREDLDFDGVMRQAFPDRGSLVRGLDPAETTIIALPEIPADTRFQDPAMTRLVEIKSGEGTYEWFANRFARAGLRVGFTGSANSHMSRLGRMSSRGITALYVGEGESWWDALRQRRTYVTSGARMILNARMNGAVAGSRISPVNERVLRGEVIGTAGISSIELLRNGEVIERRDFGRGTSGSTVRMTMESETRPWRDQRDLPRNGREWIGYLRVDGAQIDRAWAPGWTRSGRQDIAVNPDDEGRVDFITWTRGQPRSFMVDLSTDDLSKITLELRLKSGFEDVDQIPDSRTPQPIPPIRQQVVAMDLHNGPVVRRFNVEDYRDTVTFELIEPELSPHQSFEFSDTRDLTADYYYLRIRQIDDEYLWSTPFWVGGFDVH